MTDAEAGKTVLTVDDEPGIRESIGDYLEDSGFKILKAENGRAGLNIFRREKPDVVLVDLRMPEVDGLDVLDMVTRESPETPVIVVSGTGVLQDAIEALRLGAWDYILKPIEDMALLEYAVRKALERSKLLIENRKHHEHLEIEIRKRTAELEERTRALEEVNRHLQKEIIDHKRTEELFRQAQKMEAIGTLAGGIAHDFNNILFPILGYAQMTVDDVPLESLARRNLEGIIKAANRATELVRQILAFSHQGEHEQKHLKIQPIIKESLKLLRSTLPATIEIRQNIVSECGTVLADPIQIHQLMMNLCTNAYHAMRDNGGILEVILEEIILRPEDMSCCPDMPPSQYLKLTIGDTGHGIAENITERIFDPYFTTKKIGEGTGLGLSVVHGIVKTHNGHIAVYSDPGQGTTFHVYLPLLERKPEVSDEMPEEALPIGRNEKILLVDDELPIIHMMKQMLERLGYHVTEQSSSTQALKLFQCHPENFDLVITDMTMPHMTGIRLSEELMRIRADIPIILCTGFSETITADMIKTVGIREYVMKPILQHEMAGTVRRVLDEKRP